MEEKYTVTCSKQNSHGCSSRIEKIVFTSDIILAEKKRRVSIRRNQKKYLKEIISKMDDDKAHLAAVVE